MSSCEPEGVNTVANMNGNEPSVAHDGVTSESAANLATPPVRSAALGLLSAAEIWSTNANAPAPVKAPEPVASAPEKALLEKRALEEALPEKVVLEKAVEPAGPPVEAAVEAKAAPEAKPRSVRERIVAAIWPVETQDVETAAPATAASEPLHQGPLHQEPLPQETLQSVAKTEIETGEADQPVTEAQAKAAEPAPAIVPDIARATIENVQPQFASAAEMIAGLDARSFSRRIAAQESGPKPWPPRRLSLALQGGGSFAAFTWGVLERLLEEPLCEFDVISGASAGAVNAALLVSGLMEGGREAARARLKQFWDRTMQEASFRSLMLIGGYSPAGSSVSFGPALRSGRADPFDPDLLRESLAKDINFAALQDPAAPKLLVAATRVRDGSLQIFGNQAVTPDALLASTCPPQLHCAVEIDGESYWDGGYGANPPLVRLVQDSQSSEVLVVQVTPARDNYIPVTHAAIDRRLDQITANSVLNAEIAALEWARDTVAAPALRGLRLSRLSAENEIEGPRPAQSG